jgi:hypothetical protein
MNLYPRVERFESATICLPVINETTSLLKTVDTILRDVKLDLIRELLIVACERTTPESWSTIRIIQNKLADLVVVIRQSLPFWGGAMRDAFEAARGTHFVMMSSDLETNPDDVKRLIDEARRNPHTVVGTSRWLPGGAFHGYSRIKLGCNWIFQRFFSLIFWTNLTDLTFGFRILPTPLVRAIRWEEVRHPFSLECMLKLLRLGVPVSEIPTVWNARTEGESQNSFFRNFDYFRVGLKVRFARKESFVIKAPAV